MFPYLYSEMIQKKISTKKLSKLTGIPLSTLYPKMRGEKDWKLCEMRNVKKAIESKQTIDVLFSEYHA